MTARAPDPTNDDASFRIEALLARGAPWEAIDAFRDAVDPASRIHPDATLLYWGALAHARAGATREAHALLDRARGASPDDHRLHEILCLEGRLAKDEASASRETFDVRALKRSRDAYLTAFALQRDPYPGVNGATLSFLLGDPAAAHTLAAEVIGTLDRTEIEGTALDAWHTASAAEALLLLGRVDESIARYAEAARLHRGHAGNIAAMRRQLALLAHGLPEARRVLETLPAATVLAFSGHMIDVPSPRSML